MLVLMLVVVDLVILVVYTMVEWIRGNLGAERIENRENPMDTKGVSSDQCVVFCCSFFLKPHELSFMYLYVTAAES